MGFGWGVLVKLCDCVWLIVAVYTFAAENLVIIVIVMIELWLLVAFLLTVHILVLSTNVLSQSVWAAYFCDNKSLRGWFFFLKLFPEVCLQTVFSTMSHFLWISWWFIYVFHILSSFFLMRYHHVLFQFWWISYFDQPSVTAVRNVSATLADFWMMNYIKDCVHCFFYRRNK